MKILDFMNTKHTIAFFSPLIYRYVLQQEPNGLLFSLLPSLCSPSSSLSQWWILSAECGENHHNERTDKIWSRAVILLGKETCLNTVHIFCLHLPTFLIFLPSFFSLFFFLLQFLAAQLFPKLKLREKEFWWPLLCSRTKNGQGESLFIRDCFPCCLTTSCVCAWRLPSSLSATGVLSSTGLALQL